MMFFSMLFFLMDCGVSRKYFMEALLKYFIGSGHEPLREVCHSSSNSALLPGENTWLQHTLILFILSRTHHASIKGILENIHSWLMPDFQEVFSFWLFSAPCELVWYTSKWRNKPLKCFIFSLFIVAAVAEPKHKYTNLSHLSCVRFHCTS